MRKFQITLLFSKWLLHFSTYWQFKCVNVSDKAYAVYIYIQTHMCKHILLGHFSPVSFISILVPHEDSSNHSQQKNWSQTNCLSMLSHSQWYTCLHIHDIQSNVIGAYDEKSKKNLDLLLKLKTPSTGSKRPIIKTK